MDPIRTKELASGVSPRDRKTRSAVEPQIRHVDRRLKGADGISTHLLESRRQDKTKARVERRDEPRRDERDPRREVEIALQEVELGQGAGTGFQRSVGPMATAATSSAGGLVRHAIRAIWRHCPWLTRGA